MFLSIDEAMGTFAKEVSEATGFKYSKGKRTFKKTCGKMVFEVEIYSSQWNKSYESIRFDGGLCLSYKPFGKVSTGASVIASKTYKPQNGIWFDISTPEQLQSSTEEFIEEVKKSAVDLAERFEKNEKEADLFLLTEAFEEYDVYLDYLVEKLGMDQVQFKIHEIIEGLTDTQKVEIADYKNGIKNQNWMLNRSNLRYIVDNKFI